MCGLRRALLREADPIFLTLKLPTGLLGTVYVLDKHPRFGVGAPRVAFAHQLEPVNSEVQK